MCIPQQSRFEFFFGKKRWETSDRKTSEFPPLWQCGISYYEVHCLIKLEMLSKVSLRRYLAWDQVQQLHIRFHSKRELEQGRGQGQARHNNAAEGAGSALEEVAVQRIAVGCK